MRPATDVDLDQTEIALHVVREREANCRRAVDAAQRLGIYAIPTGDIGSIHWQPRMPNGCDPDLGWLLKSIPTPYGWPTWDAAVLALAESLARTTPVDAGT